MIFLSTVFINLTNFLLFFIYFIIKILCIFQRFSKLFSSHLKTYLICFPFISHKTFSSSFLSNHHQIIFSQLHFLVCCFIISLYNLTKNKNRKKSCNSQHEIKEISLSLSNPCHPCERLHHLVIHSHHFPFV